MTAIKYAVFAAGLVVWAGLACVGGLYVHARSPRLRRALYRDLNAGP